MHFQPAQTCPNQNNKPTNKRKWHYTNWKKKDVTHLCFFFDRLDLTLVYLMQIRHELLLLVAKSKTSTMYKSGKTWHFEFACVTRSWIIHLVQATALLRLLKRRGHIVSSLWLSILQHDVTLLSETLLYLGSLISNEKDYVDNVHFFEHIRYLSQFKDKFCYSTEN